MAERYYRFYDAQNNVIADNITLPYTLGGLNPDTSYPEGSWQYTQITSDGTEIGLKNTPEFRTASQASSGASSASSQASQASSQAGSIASQASSVASSAGSQASQASSGNSQASSASSQASSIASQA